MRAKRYLGLELAGAKNQKTALAALEFYPKEKKIFLLDVFERISAHTPAQTNDEALLELIGELTEDQESKQVVLGVNVPLDLPPCVHCTRKTCPLPRKCTVPSVRWMREQARKHAGGDGDFTPYTQRPVELWLKHHVLNRLPESHRFEIDETLGGNKAPLTMRMNFLKRHLPKLELLEVSPKLSMASLALTLGLSKRLVSSYRNLEAGGHAREEIIEALTERYGIFVYERDVRKLSLNLASFDAFICAFTAVLSDLNQCAKAPAGFPAGWTWITYPTIEGSASGR